MSVFSLSVDHAHSLARRVCVSVGVRDAMTSATSSAANNEKFPFMFCAASATKTSNKYIFILRYLIKQRRAHVLRRKFSTNIKLRLKQSEIFSRSPSFLCFLPLWQLIYMRACVCVY